jgi:hypothetical protein
VNGKGRVAPRKGRGGKETTGIIMRGQGSGVRKGRERVRGLIETGWVSGGEKPEREKERPNERERQKRFL